MNTVFLEKKQTNHGDCQKLQNKATFLDFIHFDLGDFCPERDDRSGN